MKRFSNFHQCAVAARLALLMVLALVLAGCSKGDVYEWGNKYTLTVETPSGPVFGFSVVGQKLLDRRNSPQFGSGNVWGLALKGEAVVVDLGARAEGPRYVFALTVREAQKWAPIKLFQRLVGTHGADYAKIAQGLKGLVGPKLLEGDEIPLLVTFADITRPETVRQVDPNDLAATFGEGYALKSITLEITDEPVTMGRVEKVLGWTRGSPKVDEIWSSLNHEAKEAIRGLREPRKLKQ